MIRLTRLMALAPLALAGCTLLPVAAPPVAPKAEQPLWAGVYDGNCSLLVQAGEERKGCDPLLFVSVMPSRTRNFVVQTSEGLVVGFRTKPTVVSEQHHEVAEVVVNEYPPLPALGHCDFVMAEPNKGSLFCECYAGGKAYRAHFRVTGLKKSSGALPH